MNRIERSILASFEKADEQSLREIVERTNIPRGTVKKYLSILVKQDRLKPVGEGRGRYYRLLLSEIADQAAVLKSGRLIGFLSYEEGRYTFEYDQSYKGKRLDGLTGDEAFYAASLFSVFENLIPESDRRDSYLSQKRNLVEILLELENTHGDFDFVPLDGLYHYEKDYTHRKNWISVKDEILQKQAFPNLLDLAIHIDKAALEAKGKHSSLSGYQNKIDVHVDFVRGVVEQGNSALYLLKPYNIENAVYNFRDKDRNYLPYMGLNEHLFMSFAKNAYEFDVPWSAVIPGEKDFHYLVKRYDRYDGYKYEQRDFAQIMDIQSNQKYFSTGERLFDAIASVVRAKEERLRFLEFYIFSFVIEHADLHLKNISIINIGKDKYRLSPLYDLISNGVYRGDSDELGLPIGGKRRNINIEDFYALSERLGISRLQTRKSIKKIVEIFADTFPHCIEKTKQIKLFDGLKVQKSRYSFGSFSENLESFYDRRIKALKKRGFL